MIGEKAADSILEAAKTMPRHSITRRTGRSCGDVHA
jgi:hypothetical protein